MLDRYYKILGLKSNASLIEVKQAYRKLAKIWHPDKFPDASPEEQQQAVEKFKEIAEAYEILKNYEPGKSTPSIFTKVKTRENLADIYYEQGVEYAENELYEEAISEFTQAIRFDSTHLKSYQYRGFILDKLGYQQRAKADFQKVKELKLNQTVTTNDREAKVSSNINVFFLENNSPVTCLAMNQNANLLVTGHKNNLIHLWDLKSKLKVKTLQRNSKAIYFLLFSPDEKTLISNEDKTICLWNLPTFNYRILGHSDKILAMSISSDSKILVSVSVDKSIKIWYLYARKETQTITSSTKEITAIEINPQATFLAIGSLEKNLRIRSLTDGKLIKSISVNSAVKSIAFSPNGELLAVGEFNHTIEIYIVETREKIGILVGHSDVVYRLIFSRDGQQIISASWDQTIKVWSVNTQQLIRTLKGHQEVISLAITPDNQIIASGNYEGKIGIWSFNV